MRRSRTSRQSPTILVLGVAGLLVLVLVLVALIDQRRISSEIAQTEADLQAVQPGIPLAEVLPSLPGFVQLATIPVAQYDPQVVTVYRKTVGQKRGTGMAWDLCVDGRGRVIAIRREGGGHR